MFTTEQYRRRPREPIMLEQLSDQLRECYERAAEARAKAKASNDPTLKADFLDMERRWLALARSYGFTERLEEFTTANAEWRRKIDGHLPANGISGPTPPDDKRLLYLASVVETSDDAIITKGLDAIITSWNKAAERIFGYAAEEAIGQSITMLIPTDRYNEEPAILARIRRGERIDHYETVRQRKDGSLIDISITVSPIKNEHGQVIGASKIARDITERKRNDARIANLSAVVESTTDSIVTQDLDGTITSWNKAAERIFGYAAEEVIGQSITVLIPPELRDEDFAILERICQGEHVEAYETIRRRKDGSLVEISLTVSPVRDAQGKIVGVSKIARDITERKLNDKRIETLAREAEHRTKNILATVQATVNLSHSDTPDGLKRSIEGRIQALANVHSLFVKSRWDGAELSNIVSQELAPYLGKDQARVHVDGPSVFLATNTAQAIAVTLHELVTNAAKYGSLSVPNGQVEVTWSRAAGDRLTLNWTESGGPPTKKPTREGFGTSVIGRIIREQSKGEMHLDWRTEGLACKIVLQL